MLDFLLDAEELVDELLVLIVQSLLLRLLAFVLVTAGLRRRAES